MTTRQSKAEANVWLGLNQRQQVYLHFSVIDEC